ncbi:MAG: histidine kinase [Myxococcota bacterium]
MALGGSQSPPAWERGLLFLSCQLLFWSLVYVLYFERGLPRGALALSKVSAGLAFVVVPTLMSSLLGWVYVTAPVRWWKNRTWPLLILLPLLASVPWTAFVLSEIVGPILQDSIPISPRLVYYAYASNAGLMILWSSVFLAVLLGRRAAGSRETSLHFQSLAAQAEAQALRAQVNPHFLFNALNSVLALIPVEPARAQQMVQDLKRLFKRAVESSATQVSTVGEELDFVHDYLRCEKARYEDRLSVTSELDPNVLEHRIPTLLLQPLVENAVKHGLGANHKIEVVIHGTWRGGTVELQVRNTGTLSPGTSRNTHRYLGDREGAGSGLRIVRGRLRLLYPKSGELDLAEADGWVSTSLRYRPDDLVVFAPGASTSTVARTEPSADARPTSYLRSGRFWCVQALGWIALYYVFFFNPWQRPFDFVQYWKVCLANFVTAMACFALAVRAFESIPSHWWSRWWGGVAALVVPILASLPWTAVLFAQGMRAASGDLVYDSGRQIYATVLTGALIMTISTSVFLTLHLASVTVRSRERALWFAAQARRSELEVLRTRMNPGFLFRSLDFVLEQIHRDPESAAQTVVDVGDMLRRGLDAVERESATIGEEPESVATQDFYSANRAPG